MMTFFALAADNAATVLKAILRSLPGWKYLPPGFRRLRIGEWSPTPSCALSGPHACCVSDFGRCASGREVARTRYGAGVCVAAGPQLRETSHPCKP